MREQNTHHHTVILTHFLVLVDIYFVIRMECYHGTILLKGGGAPKWTGDDELAPVILYINQTTTVKTVIIEHN